MAQQGEEKHGLGTGSKVALGVGAAALAGVAAIGAIGAIGGGGYLLHKNNEANKQDGSSLKLNVKVVSANNLKAADFGGTSDPYVVVTVGDVKKSSGVIKKTVNPVWNDQFQLGIWNDHLNGNVSIHIFDQDFGGDDSIGETSVAFSQIPRDTPKEFDLGITAGGVLKIQFWVSGQPQNRAV